MPGYIYDDNDADRLATGNHSWWTCVNPVAQMIMPAPSHTDDRPFRVHAVILELRILNLGGWAPEQKAVLALALMSP